MTNYYSMIICHENYNNIRIIFMVYCFIVSVFEGIHAAERELSIKGFESVDRVAKMTTTTMSKQ